MSIETIPKDLRGLRACLVCSLIKVTILNYNFNYNEQFLYSYCMCRSRPKRIELLFEFF